MIDYLFGFDRVASEDKRGHFDRRFALRRYHGVGAGGEDRVNVEQVVGADDDVKMRRQFPGYPNRVLSGPRIVHQQHQFSSIFCAQSGQHLFTGHIAKHRIDTVENRPPHVFDTDIDDQVRDLVVAQGRRQFTPRKAVTADNHVIDQFG